MKKIGLLGLVLCLFSNLAFAKLHAEISPQSGSLGDTFTLTVTDNNPQSNGLPDLIKLQENFTILGTQRNVNYTILNGQASNQTQWIVLLRPKKTGNLVIPALSINQQSTEPLSITINKNTRVQNNIDAQTEQKDIMLTLEVDNKTPYINQQIICTIRLYNRKRLLDSHYQPPEIENALLISLGDARQYQLQEQGDTYMVEEQRYAIFPQKSGELTIISPTFTALTYDVRPTEITAKAKPFKIQVKAAPVSNTGFFLPAKDLQIMDSWDNAENSIEQGSTLTRTIEIEANSVPAQFLQSLPELRFKDSQAYRVYPEKAKESNIIREGNLVGKISLKVTYLFDKPGSITLPELRLSWFNTITGKETSTALAPKTLEIKPGNTIKTEPASPVKTEASAPANMNTEAPIENHYLAWILAALFALAWLLTLGLWFKQKYRFKSGSKAWKNSLDNLKKACLSNDPEATRKTLLEWAALYWPDARILNITDIASRTNDAYLKQELHILSGVLYNQNKKNTWQGHKLWLAISAEIKAKTRRTPKSAALGPMNP